MKFVVNRALTNDNSAGRKVAIKKKAERRQRTSGPQMTGKKIFDQNPSSADGRRVVILSSVKKWLRVTVVPPG